MAYSHRGFNFYHPYPTYVDNANRCFISPDGKSLGELDADTDALFRIGKKAFNLVCPEELPDKEKEKLAEKGYQLIQATRAEFDKSYKGYLEIIDAWREGFVKRSNENTLHIKGEFSGTRMTLDVLELEDNQVMSFMWQLDEQIANQTSDDTVNALMREVYAFNALREVDNALLSMKMGCSAVAAAIGAAESLSNAIAIGLGCEQLSKARRELAYQGALEKIRRDPRQKEKIFVIECWKEWQAAPERYASKAAFSRDMLSKCEHLTSQKKIEDWCREWEKPNPAS